MMKVRVSIKGTPKDISPECEAELKKMAQRMLSEIERAKREFKEKVEDALKSDWDNLKHLDSNKPEHKVAKIMLTNVFKKLNSLGMKWR